MSAVEKLISAQEKNKSYICLGLDLDPKKMPPDSTLSIKSMYEFAMNIVEATKDHVCAYKPNLAFYEHLGHEGISLLETIVSRMPKDIPIILDCKRGDIGNTASFYAEAMFEKLNADWVTLSPYMGYDSMRPFLEYKDKGVFVLCLTSNSGSKDFQLLDVGGKPLYEIVAEKVDYWNKEHNCGLVVGATNPEQLKEIRVIAKNMPMLIPGVGAQGGSLEKSLLYGTDNFKKPAVINVSRSVLYASNGADYAEKAQAELIKLNTEAQKIKAGEFTESTIQKVEPVSPKQEAPKVQVQGFTPVSPAMVEQSPPAFPTPPIVHEETKPEQGTQHTIPETVELPKVFEQTTPPIPSPPIVHAEPKPEQVTQPVTQTTPEPEKKSEETVQHRASATQIEANRTPPPLPTPPPIPQFNREQQTENSQPVKQENKEQQKTVEQNEPRRTPPLMPTPPPILQPNPEVMRRNREEQERRLKALHEQKERQQQQNSESNENNAAIESSDSIQQENNSEHKPESSQNENKQHNNHNHNFQSRRHNRNNR